MKKPIIILSPQQMAMEEPYKGKYSYSNSFNSSAVLNAGGLPLIPPYLNYEEALELLGAADGLFLTGGGDISPELYGENPDSSCEEMDMHRDKSDFALLKAAFELNKPILCICRGMQLVNVYLGGSLYRDLESQFESSINHSQWTYPEYEKAEAHELRVDINSPLYGLLKQSHLWVNSLHHQAVKELAPGLIPMAWAPDGIVEGFYLGSSSQWLRGYQWHPEMLKSATQSSLIFSDFISACAEVSKQNL